VSTRTFIFKLGRIGYESKTKKKESKWPRSTDEDAALGGRFGVDVALELDPQVEQVVEQRPGLVADADAGAGGAGLQAAQRHAAVVVQDAAPVLAGAPVLVQRRQARRQVRPRLSTTVQSTISKSVRRGTIVDFPIRS